MTKRAKLLQNVSKKAQGGNSEAEGSSKNDNSMLLEQYRVIREDIVKLAGDLTRGYDMARDMFDNKTLMKDLLKLK